MSNDALNGSENKFYPNSNSSIEIALMLAKDENDRIGAGTFLNPNTITRLNTILPQFKAAVLEVTKKKMAYVTLTVQKEKARQDTLMLTSHFMQVFNLGAKRGKYLAGDRVLFGLHLNSEALPNLKGDTNIETAAKKVADGEARRIAAGKEAMVNPSGAEVGAAYNSFLQLTHLTANADSEYADAQKNLRTIGKEARAVVKRVWREVETNFHEGDRPRMRKWARYWGVVYGRKGGEKTVSGTITDAATGLPVPAAKVKFKDGRNKTLSNMQGHFTLITNLMHSQTLIAQHIHYSPAEVKIDLKEGVENVCAVKMEKSE